MKNDHVVIATREASTTAPLASADRAAVTTGDLTTIRDVAPADRRDAVAALLSIYELWLGALPTSDGRERFQNAPEIAALKWRLEAAFYEDLEQSVPRAPGEAVDTASALRRIARHDDASVYDWLATSATWEQLVHFLALEGGPDGGFDDLVAICQVGIHGGPKVVLGANYWDEMGRGRVDEVHTTLHERLVAAIDLPRIPWTDLPQSARSTAARWHGLLATNRWLQPELLGALGLLELQAGPRCRRVVRALRRLDAPADAFPFYEEHAETDPRHGKEWLDDAICPLVERHPEWGPRIVRGARWRAELNRRLFADAFELLDSPTAKPA